MSEAILRRHAAERRRLEALAAILAGALLCGPLAIGALVVFFSQFTR